MTFDLPQAVKGEGFDDLNLGDVALGGTPAYFFRITFFLFS